MKKTLLIFALASLFAACTPVEYDHFATITGMVIDDDDHTPIEGADISITPHLQTITTDDNGSFQFVDIEPDRYTIQVQKEGYKYQRKDVSVVAGETKNLVFYLKKKQQ